MDIDVPRLTALCARIVEAATTPDVTAVYPPMRFPSGACTWASQAGGEILAAHGFGTWTLWNAQDPDTLTCHDWLVREDVDAFVDLTAHQFVGYDAPLIGHGVNPLALRFCAGARRLPARVPDSNPTMARWRDALLRAVPPPTSRAGE